MCRMWATVGQVSKKNYIFMNRTQITTVGSWFFILYFWSFLFKKQKIYNGIFSPTQNIMRYEHIFEGENVKSLRAYKIF